jgi:hypothetical protein
MVQGHQLSHYNPADEYWMNLVIPSGWSGSIGRVTDSAVQEELERADLIGLKASRSFFHPVLRTD